MSEIVVGFMGAGGIARSHAYSLESLKFFYDAVPKIEFRVVTSKRKESRESFASKYNFDEALEISEFIKDKEINTVFILGPNKVHYEHLLQAAQMTGVKRIYLEKPVCSSLEEENGMNKLLEEKSVIP